MKVIVRKAYEKKLACGLPLITQEALLKWDEVKVEGTILDLYTTDHRFVGRGYYGRQNKGMGWLLTKSRGTKIDLKFFTEKLKIAINRRKKYFLDTKTTAFRVFNGEGDGIGGLTIDYLDGHYLMTWYSVGIYCFKELILEALEVLVTYKSIYEKKRFDTKGTYLKDKDFLKGVAPKFPMIVLENGIKFPVYLEDGPMIGVFLDQKDVRKRLKEAYSKDKHILNTFSYTGAFSVSAALGGAASTTSVDLANRSRPRTEEMFKVNGLQLDNHHIIVEDVFNYFTYGVKKSLEFDVVILDPPSFARSNKRTFSVHKDYGKLLEQAIQITSRGGVILASTNYSNGDMKWFKNCVQKAFLCSKKEYEILESYTLPDDFSVCQSYKASNYLKVLFIKVK